MQLSLLTVDGVARSFLHELAQAKVRAAPAVPRVPGCGKCRATGKRRLTASRTPLAWLE